MDVTKSILQDIRVAVGLDASTSDFDGELIPHINSAIGELTQIGVGKPLVINDDKSVWADLQDPLQINGNVYFQMIPQFIMLRTKILFDPPPPSSVQFHASSAERILWRLKIAYEEPYTTTTTTVYE